MSAIDTAKAGDVLYDVRTHVLLDSSARWVSAHQVTIVAIDHERDEVVANYQGHAPRKSCVRWLSTLVRDLPAGVVVHGRYDGDGAPKNGGEK